MKRFLSLIIALAFTLTAVAAFADSEVYNVTLMSNSSGTGTAYKVTGYPFKTVVFGHHSGAAAFNTYSGIVTVQCKYGAQPYTTCKDVAGNAITKTHDTTATGAVFTIRDLADYIRVVYTKTKHNISVYMNYAQEKIAR